MYHDKYKLEYYSSVKAKNVNWLWYPYIPYGKITIVQGDPGEGKSTLMLQLTSLLTTGKEMPDGNGGGEIRNVIYQAAEDGLEDTIKPRLEKAGADCDRVAFLDLENGMMNLDDSRFEKAIMESQAGLLVVDPMQAFMNCDSDGIKSGSLRSVLTKIAKVAERTGCAVVLVGHLNKKTGVSKEIYRGLGSIEFAAVARSVLLVERDSCNPNLRIMRHIKSSLAPEGPGYVFKLDPWDGFCWIGENRDPQNDESEKLSDKPETKKTAARKFIEEALTDRDFKSEEILTALREKGISERTAKEAKTELNITTYRSGNCWYWHLEGN